MSKYVEMFGKKYLKCTCCKHYNDGLSKCKLFDALCSTGDGCQEKIIETAEHNKE